MKKTLVLVLVTVVVVGGGAFYGGMKYSQSTRQNPALFQKERGLGGQQGMIGGAGTRGSRLGTGFASGEIIAKDDPAPEQARYGASKSVTVKLLDARLPDGQGGSKIVFYSDSTEIGKFVNGTLSDLEVGEIVTVNGEANQDGSITAKTIQIRPAMPAPTSQ